MHRKMTFTAIFILLMSVQQRVHCDKNVDDTQTKVSVPADLNVAGESANITPDLLTELEKPESEDQTKPEAIGTRPETELTIENLFMEGVRAYNQHEWYTCADKLETAIKDHRLHKQVMSDCRLDCRKGIRVSKLSNVTSSVRDLSHFAQLVREADCFRRCIDESGITISMLSASLENAFEKRVPYQYLQYCYFMLGRQKAAASAAYTYLLANPTDVDMKHNIVFYRDKAKVASTEFQDQELLPYKDHYISGLKAYAAQDWGSATSELEEGLKEYFHEHERCLSDCGAIVTLRGAEFSSELADMFINNLYCQLNCEEKLSIIHIEPVSHFLQEMLHYLQFAYYQDGKVDKSVETVASFLVLNSSHVIMQENKNVIKTKHAYTDDDFKPRKDVVDYADMRKEMENLMYFLSKNYRWPYENHELTSKDMNEQPKESDVVEDDWIARYGKLGIHVIAMPIDLHRERRFVVDGLLKEEQCDELLTLTQGLTVDEKASFQKFDLKIAQQRLKENLDEEYESSVRQFIQAKERVDQHTRRILSVQEQVFLRDAAIVCRAPSEDAGQADKCFPQEDGSCVRLGDMSDQLSANTYITVTYLRTADGDFQFLDQFGQADSSFGVQCGRTVGFAAGDRHLVKLPRRGEHPRCAMVLGFITDRQERSKDYQNTLTLLQKMGELRYTNQLQSGRNKLKEFEDKGVRIVKRSEELKGKERFVADGLASDAQCTTLINMVELMVVVADEHNQKSPKAAYLSPHTEHEQYVGITVYRSSKLAHQGRISVFGLKTFLELSDNSRQLVESYFNLTKPLYFDYTFLVCRSPLEGSKFTRHDLSHPVHADNCNLQPDGSCTRDFPAYIHRTYSAILYLNAEFEGGEFFFAHSNTTEQVSLRPKCGRLVAFNAGDFHGVKAVRSGRRCAMALFFTQDSIYKEVAHIQAQKTLKKLEEEQKAEDRPAHEDL